MKQVYVVRWSNPISPVTNGIHAVYLDKAMALQVATTMSKHNKGYSYTVKTTELFETTLDD